MISVIIPFRNSAEWIERCYKSIKGSFEIICVNDNSTDGSEKLVPCINNEHAQGVSGARNTGIEHAHGEWVTFLDADDEMLPNAYHTFMSAPKGDVVQFNHLRHYPSLGIKMKYANREGRYEIDNLPKCWFGVWNKLFRADFIKDIRFNEDLQYGEDGLFVLECFKKGAVITHAPKDMVTVVHRFDNRQSLSHIKTQSDVLKQIHAYEDFMLSLDNYDLRVAVCKELSRLWGLDRIQRIFGVKE